MKRIKNYVFGSFGQVVLIGSIVFAGSAGSNTALADKEPQEHVKLINASAEPVPTQAPKSVSSDAGITDTPTLQIGNAANTPILVRDVDNPARQPFLETLVTSNNTSFTAPLGKRLVIEFVSGVGNIPSGQRFQVVFLKTGLVLNGTSIDANNYFTPVLTGSADGFDTFVVSQQTRLYVESGGTVRLSTAATAEGWSFTVTISGYLVDR